MHYLCIMFRKTVSQYITEKALFHASDKILVALSGGADSVALLRVLLSLGYICECAHCNFHLRGQESDRDEDFVRILCCQLSIPLHVTHFDTTAYATAHHISIEMAARELRYQWFEQLRKECGAAVIAVAHHQNDSVETVLLNLIRGTGIKGLRGIQAKNGNIVRPMLQVSREQILDYLNHINQDYVVDSTNLQDEYMRNKIRLSILPLMKEMNPSVNESIVQTAEHLSQVSQVYHHERYDAMKRVVKPDGSGMKLSIASLLEEVSPQSLLFEMLYPYGFQSSQIADIYHSLFTQSGKCFFSGTHRLLRDRDNLYLEPISHNDDILPELSYELVEITPDFILPRDKETACLDADKVTIPLTIRKWERGDKFYPLGMKGKKNISDYLTDKKFTLFEKERQYVACQDDDIVWLVEERIDHRFRITSSSKLALIIRIKRAE